MKPIIKVENLSKQYHIGVRRAPYGTLRESLVGAVRAPFKRLRRNGHSADTTIWALKDVSFDVMPGEVVGVIGRNGAGKSTLLKILSRITEPTSGGVDLYGRVGSLLEVGTGFHPELTGRENVYLNGAVLGMNRNEIDKKFDEIVAFAEVEKFLDTPVKYYSSGMYVRLAFAVAAHLEPEILLVDEVLAVGDAAFQKKCLGKMEDVAGKGRTVLFVSHNMAAIQTMCSHCIYLRGGETRVQGRTEQVIPKYLSDTNMISTSPRKLKDRRDGRGQGKVRIVDFYVLDRFDERQDMLKPGEDYVFVMEYEKRQAGDDITNVVGSIAISDDRGQWVFLARSNFTNQNFKLSGSFGQIRCCVRDFNLAAGIYSSILYLSHGEEEVLDQINDAATIVVGGGDFFGTGLVGLPSLCKILNRAEWIVSCQE
jgi:lipopolysaccharide transport system ATP-binding protein